MKTIAILGFGCAGYHCAKTLRELGYEGAIHVFSDTDLPPYNPMLTTYYAGHRLPWKGLFPFGSLSDIARSLRLTVHTGAAAIHLDTPGKTLYLRPAPGYSCRRCPRCRRKMCTSCVHPPMPKPCAGVWIRAM